MVAGWQAAASCLAVSRFVASYVSAHVGEVRGAMPLAVRHLPLCAFGVFGDLDQLPNLGSRVAEEYM